MKECKMSEIRALQKVGWHVDLEQCKLVERAVCELVNLASENGQDLTKEEKAFVRVTVLAIEEGLQRKCKIEDLVERMSQ